MYRQTAMAAQFQLVFLFLVCLICKGAVGVVSASHHHQKVSLDGDEDEREKEFDSWSVLSQKNSGCDIASSRLNRSSFSPDFIFGVASSAYQYEGAAFEDGKGQSIWDTFSRIPGNIVDRSNGDVAVNFYNLYKDDVKLMKIIGIDAFRMSISWPRILPRGKLSGGVNKEGIAFYNNVFDELLANGITPFVALFHWDLPQALEDEYGGFLSPLIIDDFRDFAEICFKEFGDRIKHWITINEPYMFPNPNISSSTDDMVYLSSDIEGVPIGDPTGVPILYVYPQGLHDLLLYTKQKYNISNNIYVTETGIADIYDTGTQDQQRIDYFCRHFEAVQLAIQKGVNVKGFFAWSLLDNFEWTSGFTVRFGLYYVDYNNGLKRIPKRSAAWFMNFLNFKSTSKRGNHTFA